MFQHSPALPFVMLLEDNFAAIRAEAERLRIEEYDDWPDRDSYSEGWKVFGLFAASPTAQLAWTCPRNSERCPHTASVCRRIRGLHRAGFSMLLPGAHIYPHADSEDHMRCHLCLRTNPAAGIRVAGQDVRWTEGRCLVFDSHTPHEAANLGSVPRLLLLLDVDPGDALAEVAAR